MASIARRKAHRDINIRLDRLDQLYDMLDPHALWYRQVSDRIEKFILEEARPLSRTRPICIRLHIAGDEIHTSKSMEIESAIQSSEGPRVRRSLSIRKGLTCGSLVAQLYCPIRISGGKMSDDLLRHGFFELFNFV